MTWYSPVLADRRQQWNQRLVAAVFPEQGNAAQAVKLMAVGAAGVLALILLALFLIWYVRVFPRLPAGAIGVYEAGAGPGTGFRRIDQFVVRRRRVKYVSDVVGALIRVRGRRVPGVRRVM